MKLLWRSFAALQKLHTAITAQTNHKKKFESVALQRFQISSCGSFERKAQPFLLFKNEG